MDEGWHQLVVVHHKKHREMITHLEHVYHKRAPFTPYSTTYRSMSYEQKPLHLRYRYSDSPIHSRASGTSYTLFPVWHEFALVRLACHNSKVGDLHGSTALRVLRSGRQRFQRMKYTAEITHSIRESNSHKIRKRHS